VHKFCTTLMEKTVGEIGILNSDLFSDQFFLQCTDLDPGGQLITDPPDLDPQLWSKTDLVRACPEAELMNVQFL
jgi:hypothetical protein